MSKADETRLIEALNAQNWPTAEKLLKRRCSKSSATAADFYNLGSVQIELGRIPPAIQSLKKAAKQAPKDLAIWLQLGRAALEVEDLALARTAFGRAHTLDPQNPLAKLNFGKLSLRLGEWRDARSALEGIEGADAQTLAFRAAAELDPHAARGELNRLLRQPGTRAAAVKVMAKTARACIPMRLPPQDGEP